MDSQDKGDSQTRLRDEALARRMGEALDRMMATNAPECPDADQIAAYHERALHADEMAQWEGHFAGCSRCRKILAVLAASVDAPLAETEVARLGQLVAAATARPARVEMSRTAPQVRSSRFDWRARWVAPALGVAAVLAVWIAIRAPWRKTDRGASATLIAQAPKPEEPLMPEAADRTSRVAPELKQKAEAGRSLDRAATKGTSPNSPVEAPAQSRNETTDQVSTITEAKGAASNSIPDDKEKKLGELQTSGGIQPQATAPPPPPASKTTVATAMPALASAPPPPPPAVPQFRAQATAPTTPAPEVTHPENQSVAETESVPLVETTNATLGGAIQPGTNKDLPLNGRNYQNLALIGPGAKFSALLKAPSGSILWRAGKGGIIEASSDSGKDWVAQKSPSKEDWLAGLAISDRICWLVGRNGAIARSTDGRRWKRIDSPTQRDAAGKLPDWNKIDAQDALNATIAAVDGRSYTTEDGGKSWQAR